MRTKYAEVSTGLLQAKNNQEVIGIFGFAKEDDYWCEIRGVVLLEG